MKPKFNALIYLLVPLVSTSIALAEETKQSQASIKAESTFLTSVKETKATELKKLFTKSANLNEKDSLGNTALMLAITNENKTLAKLLIDKKADLNLKNNEGQSALYIALVNEQPDIAIILINKGASLENISSEGDSALLIATTTNAIKVMKLVLKMNAALINQVNKHGTTPILEAARFGSTETIMILLNAGANKTIKNSAGMTALEVATKAQNSDAIKLLQK